MTGVAHLVVGPEQHGVCEFGRVLADLMGHQLHTAAHPVEVSRLAMDADVIHCQFTDALFGVDIAQAAATFADMCTILRRRADRVSVTLHDLPDRQDTPARWRRRAATYAQVLAAVDTVVVSSRHERERLTAAVGPVDAAVIPLPLTHAPGPVGDRPAPFPEVAVFGFLYPGKGHDEVLSAVPPGATLTALGRPAQGHENLADLLAAQAAQTGRVFRLEGYLPAEHLIRRLRQVAVPVVPGRRVSASGSLNTWLRAGRRPLVADGAYAREFAGRFPAGVRLYLPDELPDHIAADLENPDAGWLSEPVPEELTGPAVAQAYRDALGLT